MSNHARRPPTHPSCGGVAAQITEPFRSPPVVNPSTEEDSGMTFRSTLAVTMLLASTAFAAAQTVVITPEEQVIVREYVKTNPVIVERPSNFELVVGAIIPDILKPGALADNKYQYVVMDGRTVLIDPQTRKVVYIMD
ncbi:DUF1236 domain-containing protein [Aminobacter ciceronei]|nr:DUF1236 domain-containing protein [Aminobacter ciceronei]